MLLQRKYNFTSDYLGKIYCTSDFSKTINRLAAQIISFKKKHPIGAIAFTGTSGASVAYPLSYKLKIPLICIRKGRHHAYSNFEGRTDAKTYVIVDDFIESGRTILRIKKIVKTKSDAKLIAIFLYNSNQPDEEIVKGVPIITNRTKNV